ncbi:hypothetical protein N7G274_005958 [Stereocaulon virgatum]|uniref:Uncharacterized protein n=1 Tax=Stereocaulon virgatum TaxID=373712 RepID=A0ABR4A847_9LECA
MCVYALWLRKPFNVWAPILVSTVGLGNLIALLLTQSRPMGTTPYNHLALSKYYEPSRDIRSEASYLIFDDTRRAESPSVLNDPYHTCKRITITEAFDDTPEEMAPTSRKLCNIREVSAPENRYTGNAERPTSAVRSAKKAPFAT